MEIERTDIILHFGFRQCHKTIASLSTLPYLPLLYLLLPIIDGLYYFITILYFGVLFLDLSVQFVLHFPDFCPLADHIEVLHEFLFLGEVFLAPLLAHLLLCYLPLILFKFIEVLYFLLDFHLLIIFL